MVVDGYCIWFRAGNGGGWGTVFGLELEMVVDGYCIWLRAGGGGGLERYLF